MVVYGDLLFLVNFSMDFLCFYISCRLLHQKLPTLRACIAAFAGGIYSVVSLFLEIDPKEAFALDISVLFIMCLTVYLQKSVCFKKILKGIFLYFFVSALLGGLMTALFSLFNRMEIFASDVGMSDGIDVWIFALLVVIGSFFTLKGGKVFRSSAARKVVYLEIESDMGVVNLRALVDSGNLASEPISGKSVAFVSVEKCKNIVDKSIYNVINNNSNLSDAPLNTFSKIRMIPTRALSGKSFLPALKFKKVTVKNGSKKKNIDVYIAFVGAESLGEYDAIISDETIV